LKKRQSEICSKRTRKQPTFK